MRFYSGRWQRRPGKASAKGVAPRRRTRLWREFPEAAVPPVEQPVAHEYPLLVARAQISSACGPVDGLVMAKHMERMHRFELHPPNALARWASAERLDTLVGLLTERLIDPAGIMPYAYRRDWRPVAGVAWTGHQFQMARTIALAACSPRLTFQALARSRELVDSCLLHARHPQGGFRFAFNAKRSSMSRSQSQCVSWLQSSNMTADAWS